MRYPDVGHLPPAGTLPIDYILATRGIAPEDFPDNYLIEIVPQVDVMLSFAYYPKGRCTQVCIFLRGPVPQLGDCVRYFRAHGTPAKLRGWRLPGGILVLLDKEEDEVCCQFLPVE